MQLAGFAIQFVFLGQTLWDGEGRSYLSEEGRVGSGFTFVEVSMSVQAPPLVGLQCDSQDCANNVRGQPRSRNIVWSFLAWSS